MGSSSRDKRKNRARAADRSANNTTNAVTTPTAAASSKTFNERAVSNAILTKSQLTVIIVVALGVSRLLQLQNSLLTTTNTDNNNKLCESFLAESVLEAHKNICSSATTIAWLQYKSVSMAQALLVLALTAISGWKQEPFLVKLTAAYIIVFGVLLTGILLVSNYNNILQGRQVYGQVLILIVLVAVSVPQEIRTLPYLDAHYHRWQPRQPVSIASLASLTMGMMYLYLAYELVNRQQHYDNTSLSSSSLALLLRQLVAVDYAAIGIVCLTVWRYGSPTNLQPRFGITIGIVHTFAYLHSWPNLYQKLLDHHHHVNVLFPNITDDGSDEYERLRMVSLVLGMVVGPLVWLVPTTMTTASKKQA